MSRSGVGGCHFRTHDLILHSEVPNDNDDGNDDDDDDNCEDDNHPNPTLGNSH